MDQYIRKVTTMSGCRGCNVPKKSIRHGTNKTTAKVKASAEFGPCILAFLGAAKQHRRINVVNTNDKQDITVAIKLSNEKEAPSLSY